MTKDHKPQDAASESEQSTSEGSPLHAVSALMEERRRFEGWIATLEAKRATTPERVFERVHADYTSRLEGVLVLLASHAGGLRAELESLTVRLSALEDERQSAQDERAEAELRAHVGELSASDWEQTSSASDAKLSDLSSRHAEVAQELARTRELLADAERPATPPTPVLAQARTSDATLVVTAEAADGESAEQPPAFTETNVPASMTEPAVSAADACDLEVMHRTPAPGEAIPTPDATTEAPALTARAPTPPRASRFDELAFLSSVVDTPSGALDSGPSDRLDESARRDNFAMQGSDDSIVNLSDRRRTPLDGLAVGLERDEQPLSAHVSGSTPLVPRDKSDGTKTLKCSECGAMNYPTEWYCERCGAELASL